MPLKIVKIRKVTADDALNALVATSAVSKQIADIMQFPPAQAAAGILLLVFETIQKIQANKDDCYRLAQRCLSMLVDIRDHMTEHQDSAPPSLLKAITKFEEALESIYKFMKQEAEQTWGTRLMRKGTIELAMKRHHLALDDAVRSFQIASLINIQLSLGGIPGRTKAVDGSMPESAEGPESSQPSGTPQSREATLPAYSEELVVRAAITDVAEICFSPGPTSALVNFFLGLFSEYEMLLSAPGAQVDAYSTVPSEVVEDFRIIEHQGFNQYHQSQFVMKGKSRIKSGWWGGGVEGDLDGRRSFMLRYEGNQRDAMKRWMRDVKLLQNIYHPNLPQMIGYSNDETPTPFIVLANVQTRLPQAMLLDAVKHARIGVCLQMMLRFVSPALDAALYLQRQMNLSDSKLQDYVENADLRIDAENTVVMGLPPPEIDRVHSWRNYGLAYSIRSIFLKILPGGGYAREPVDVNDQSGATIEKQRKISHLTMIARTLLPDSENMNVVKKRLQDVLTTEDDEDEEAEVVSISLRQLRMAALANGMIQHAWHRNTVPPNKFAVGDLGYLPPGSIDWSEFVLCCNVYHDDSMNADIESRAAGMQGSWIKGGGYDRQELTPFDYPGGISGWPVVVLPEADFTLHINHEDATTQTSVAWNYLLENGRSLAAQYGVGPEELILVSRVGCEQRFRVRDLRKVRHWPASVKLPPHPHRHRQQQTFPGHFGHQPFGSRTSGGEERRLVQGQDLAPKLFYLFTSGDKDYQSHFSQRPMPSTLKEGEKAPELDANVVQCFAYPTDAFGYLDYVQLHAEDYEL
ncbi:hypothetical protein PYCCODRAFT_1444280 [Trametes coccinea BRFM310]|uniref:Mixed lineage kinase domain-containing protein n=1 Tax=Trametes coccinea (strain BRFM310) TaxID=1353009 RepID=A0A1Y2IRC3_TRAC3|nr:hypothetical protein PYCCODRAFT_1444280 [Trametes coccinea BRFM310]